MELQPQWFSDHASALNDFLLKLSFCLFTYWGRSVTWHLCLLPAFWLLFFLMISDWEVTLIWQQWKIVTGIPPKRVRPCSLFGIHQDCCSLPSFVSYKYLAIKRAVVWGMHTLPLVKFEHGDETSFYLPCKWTHFPCFLWLLKQTNCLWRHSQPIGRCKLIYDSLQ